jgi:hypothetical protein
LLLAAGTALSLVAVSQAATAAAAAPATARGENQGAFIGSGAPSEATPGTPNTPSNFLCTGWWNNAVSNVYFYSTGARLNWDFYFTNAAQEFL